MDIQGMFLVALLVANPVEPLACPRGYQIPQVLVEQFEKEAKGKMAVIEIRSQEPLGYITSFFYNRLYLEGWFYETKTGVVACDITFAIEFDEDGSLLFIWQPNEKGA